MSTATRGRAYEHNPARRQRLRLRPAHAHLPDQAWRRLLRVPACLRAARQEPGCRMTETVMCDGCGQDTPWIDWCDHGRITCTECINFAPCKHCRREARP